MSENENEGAQDFAIQSGSSRNLFAASQSSDRVEKPTREPIFTTKKPEGAYRDEIVIEMQTLDAQPFRGTITTKEARRVIFEKIVGFKQEDLVGFYFAYSGCPVVTFKLREQFNIDDLKSFQEFDLERTIKVQNVEKTSKIRCKIRGIRSGQNADDKNYRDEGVCWLKVEECEYRLEEQKIIDWLPHFGEIKSKISEDTHGGSDDSDDDFPSVGNGIYSVKMKLSKEMPQLIPMFGKRIGLYYRGIVKRCTNCFGTHLRKTATTKKLHGSATLNSSLKPIERFPRSSMEDGQA